MVISKGAIKAFAKGHSLRETRFNVGSFTPMPDNYLRNSMAVNSGPLSDQIYSGIPLIIMAFWMKPED